MAADDVLVLKPRAVMRRAEPDSVLMVNTLTVLEQVMDLAGRTEDAHNPAGNTAQPGYLV